MILKKMNQKKKKEKVKKDKSKNKSPNGSEMTTSRKIYSEDADAQFEKSSTETQERNQRDDPSKSSRSKPKKDNLLE